MARTTSLTWSQYSRLWTKWSQEIMASPTAFKIDGRPVAALNNLSDFASCYGRTTFAIMLEYGSGVAERILGVRPYLLGVIGQADPHNVRLAATLPVDGVTGYGLLPNWLGNVVQQYDRLVDERVADWEHVQRRLDKPFFPVVCAGWDATVRGDGRNELRASDGYPYCPVVVGATVAGFAHFLDEATSFNSRWQPRENVVFLHAWNEWTECSVIEPSDRFGRRLLDEVRARVRRLPVAMTTAPSERSPAAGVGPC